MGTFTLVRYALPLSLIFKKGMKLGLCPKKHLGMCLTLKHVKRLFIIFDYFYSFLLPGCSFNGVNVHLCGLILKENDS